MNDAPILPYRSAGKRTYEQKIVLNDLKGTPANVVVVAGWSADGNSVTMASAYIKEEK